ncbi:propionyl-CoA synthetase [Mycobacterium antarcticum]|uniref:propionyl-CoA synthetase n=1 Tax=Mycolicibacterium sp. TUM20985 TaxID=3023370 RepID=UPI0025733B2E|nr:propionyl-CoA synthetase [Mycolicibacterium sp. TUM20985]BDX30602.1 propionyl-CoA synthetase [Mycolicibacterium sp. TUM20985]
MARYREMFDASIEDARTFWGDAAREVTWTKAPQRVLDDDHPPFYRWFPDGELNTCANALDRHVEHGRGEQAALIYDSPLAGTKRTYTYRELLDETARFAGVLRGLGVGKGDRVVIYMPMVPEAVIAMLACARLGAVHSVVFGGFAAHELAVRIDDARPAVVVSASCGIEPTRIVDYKSMVDHALDLAEHTTPACVVLQRDQAPCELTPGRDVSWADAMTDAQPVDPVPVAATDPLYVLYTSGTTGKPKGIVRDNGGHAVALLWTMRHIYDTEPGDVYWAASDVGWVVGHSYIVYGPLLLGATTVLYEGKPVATPDAGAFWRVVAEYGVKALFSAPTAIRAIKKDDPDATLLTRYDVSSLRYLFQAGERLDPATYHWASEKLGIPVVDHWWQTETGWSIAAAPMGVETMPIKPGSATVPMPGYDVRVLRPDGTQCAAGEEGSICIKLPLPPGTLPTLWGDDDRYVASYLSAFEGYYLSGDGGYLDWDGYLFVMGRTDDTINIAGHRLSTGAIEAALATHPAVAECAVIGVSDPIKGQVPRGFVVLKSGASADGLVEELVAAVRDNIGAVASLKRVDIVPALPKTRSGKILRKTMRGIADGRDEPVPSTIEDVGVLDALTSILKSEPMRE